MDYFTTCLKSSRLLAVAGVTLALVGCIANPTPHPAGDATNSAADAFTADTALGGGDGTTSYQDAFEGPDTPWPDVAPPFADAAADSAADATADGAADASWDGAADGAGDGSTADAEGDATPDALDGGDVSEPGPFACGSSGLTCEADKACQSMGQGACGGDPPDANGQCPADCYATECGGGVYCLCDFFECVDLPTGCGDCSCVGQEYEFCICDDSDGSVRLNCPGA